jgi:myo-inositol catabolism protein IolC
VRDVDVSGGAQRGGDRTFVLAIDHRASFRKWAAACLGREAPAAVLSDLKLVVADALVEALATGLARERAAILAETEYGSAAIARAREAGVRVIVPAERSGMPEFMFEHGDDFPAAILASGTDVVKALVRYNPSSDRDRLARSRDGLFRLARWCEEAGYPLMLELLVPPAQRDLDEHGAARPDFDDDLRPALTCAAIAELRGAGMRPQWWKLEGQPDASAFTAVAVATGAAGGETSCLVLGRGAGDAQLVEWVATAAGTVGFSGFAVGRSLWAAVLEDVLLGQVSREEAAQRISRAYLELVAVYEQAEPQGQLDRSVV